jgi:hypothetical protein
MKPEKTVRMLLCSILLMLLSMPGKAQDTTRHKIREYYLTLGNFSPINVNLRYKKQIREKMFFKVGLVSLSANYNHSGNGSTFPTSNENYSGGLECGVEWRRTMTKKLTLFHGPALRGVYELSVNRNRNPAVPQNQQTMAVQSLSGSVPYSIGLLFHAYENFFVSAEINPSFYFSYRDNLAQNPFQHAYGVNAGFGFDNRYGQISLVYRR